MGLIDKFKSIFRRGAAPAPEVNRANENEYREHIYKIWKDSKAYHEYLAEAELFKASFGKDVNCYVCGFDCGLDAKLYDWNDHRYCEEHLPAVPGSPEIPKRMDDWKVTAIGHEGTSSLWTRR